MDFWLKTQSWSRLIAVSHSLPAIEFCNTTAFSLLWPPYGIGQAIIFCPVISSFYLLFFLADSQPSQIGCLPYFYTWCGLSANLGCRSETCCMRLAENTGHKKLPKILHLCTIAQLCRAISSQLRHVSTIKKNLLNSNISPTCPHNIVNFGPLAAEIGSLVWAPQQISWEHLW